MISQGTAQSEIPIHSISVTSSCNGATIAGYTLEELLGSGSFANVYKATRRHQSENGESCVEFIAIKVIDRDSQKLTKKVLENLELEISILQTYRHPNIVCLHQVHKTDRYIHLLLEFCSGGDLQHLIRSRKFGRLSERLVRRLMRDLSSGLMFLASQNLIHRDIKPQNLLLTGPLPLDEEYDPCISDEMEQDRRRVNFDSNKFHLKIADFGFARHLKKTSLADTLCGSPLYMAPEILQHQRYDNKADLWSAGTVMFEMITGRPPFHGENHIDLLRNIQQKAVRLPPDLQVSPNCVKLLRILLNRNPISRAGFREFIEATNDFVGLGCNGVPATLNADISVNQEHKGGPVMYNSLLQVQTPLIPVNLGPISEIEESSMIASSYAPRKTAHHNHDFNVLTGRNTPVQISPLHHPLVAPSSPALIPTKIVSKQSLSNAPEKKSESSLFTPLEPSPPGPRSLEGYMQSSFTLNSPKLQYANQVTENDSFQNPSNKNSNHSSDDSSSGGFVMVDKGGPLRVEEMNLSSSPFARWTQSTSRRSTTENSPPDSPGGKGSNSSYFFPQKTILSSRNLIPPISFLKKGMLSTSPGTGGLLVGMMGTSNVPKTNIVTQNECVQIPSKDFDTLTKILAAADDVGRRAVNVAHVGDTRAYFAMHLIFHANDTSVLSENLDTPLTQLGDSKMRERSRTISNDLTLSRRNSSIVEEEHEEDDEMPFVLDEDGSNNTELSFRTEKDQYETNEAKIIPPSTDASIRCYFREALMCYIKALSMLKGSVNASQKVLSELSSITSVSPVTENDPLVSFRQRCEVSHRWLAGQFKGVLERANAANDEIAKLSVDKELLESNTMQEKMASCVEELIYNHSLVCGKDGAVKQLLGQYDAARACYRSAGLLAETLLMEHKLVEEDRKVLEDYVQGFSDRINEIDSLMVSQSRQSMNSSFNRSVNRIQSSRRSFSMSSTASSYGRGLARSNISRS